MENQEATPESILAVLPIGNNLVPRTDLLPDEIVDYSTATLPAGVSPTLDPYYLSNINAVRYIKGETVRLPVASPNAFTGGLGSVYMLKQGPVFNSFRTVSGTPVDSLQVYGAALERVEQSSVATNDRPDPTAQLRDETQYAIDYKNLQIAFSPRILSPSRPAERRFVFQYDYFVVNGGNVAVRTVLTGEIRVPDVTLTVDGEVPPPVWQPIFGGLGTTMPADFNASLGIRRNSEDVSRRYRLLTTSVLQNSTVVPVWSDDPYEYVWYSRQFPNSSNAGILLFNPLGRTGSRNTAQGERALTARVDYMTFDNHIIREDRVIPNAPPYEVKLSLQEVATQGDILSDQTRYNGMFRSANATPSVMVFNPTTGQQVQAFAGTCTQGIGRDGLAFTINARTGTIRFGTTFIENSGLRSANLRFFYRGQKDWGMQMQKAQARYYAADAPNQLNYRSFYVGGSAGVGRGTRLYFPRSEAGKSVALGEYFVRTNLSGADSVKHFAGETYQITPNTTNFDTDLRLPFLDLRDLHPEAAAEAWQFDAVATGLAVNNVQGISMKSRVLWLDGTNQIQDQAGNNVIQKRWRRLDIDTVLSKNITR
jgi:hypothetical protein